MTPCPCESGLSLAQCCGPIIDGSQTATTAEALMRSRYTAYVQKNRTYLHHSWHPSTYPKNLNFNDDTRWLGLKIKNTVDGSRDDESGSVEFVARFKIASKGHRLHETSQFTRLNGRWVYLNGKLNEK